MTTTCLGPTVRNCTDRFCWYHGNLPLRKVGESFKFHRTFRTKGRNRAQYRLSRTAARVLLVMEGPCRA